MKVKFREDKLELEDGTFLEIPKEGLLEACLQNDYRTISIFEIVKKSLKDSFDYDVSDHRYRQSELFDYLEKGIQNDERYRIRKREVIDSNREMREKAKQGKQNAIVRHKEAFYQYLKRQNRLYYSKYKNM